MTHWTSLCCWYDITPVTEFSCYGYCYCCCCCLCVIYLHWYVSLAVTNVHAHHCFTLILLNVFIVNYFLSVCVYVDDCTGWHDVHGICLSLCVNYCVYLCVCFSLCLFVFLYVVRRSMDVLFYCVDQLCLFHVYILSAALCLPCSVIVSCNQSLLTDCCCCYVIVGASFIFYTVAAHLISSFLIFFGIQWNIFI